MNIKICGGAAAVANKMVMEDIEIWRKEFALDVLNELATFYETTVEQRGFRVVDVKSLGKLASDVLDVPGQFAEAEATARGWVEDGEDGSKKVRFTSLLQFMTWARGMVERVVLEAPNMFWTSDDLAHVSLVFQAYAVVGRVPSARLFVIVEALGLAKLQFEDSEQQRWFAGITQKVLNEVTPPKDSVHPVGTLGFLDFVRIVTAAMRDLEQTQRKAEYKQEAELRTDANYTLVEMEDMRELYNLYLGTRVGVPASRLEELLASLGVRELSPEEISSFRSIVRSHTPMEDLRPDRDVSFPVFARWMRVIFDQSIGGLRWFGDGTMLASDLEDRKGFVPATLREVGLPTEVGESRRSVESSSRRRSFYIGPDPKGGLAPPTAAPVNRISVAAVEAATASGSLAAFRSRGRGKTQRMERPEKPRGRLSSRPRPLSKQGSLQSLPSVGGSRPGSRAQSRAGSCHPSKPAVAEARHDSRPVSPCSGRDGPIMVLNPGLPSSDVMLGGRKMRPTSAQNSPHGSSGSAAVAAGKVADRLLMPMPVSSTRASARQVKEGLCSDLVVSEAIVKLNFLDKVDNE